MGGTVVAIFLSAVLLFQVQPLIARAILPWFGGGPGVWTVCMLFFQAMLVLGYAYAHVVSARLRVPAQRRLHLALLGLSVLLLPITPADRWRPLPAADPTGQIILLLAVTVGAPFFLLATTAPLLQRWRSVTRPERSPYRLYAVSNLGSLLGLLAYPFVVEPTLPLTTQAIVWSVGYVLFVVATAVASRALAGEEPARAAEPAPVAAVWSASARDLRALWLLLPACASVMLLATTNQVCQDVAAVPFLWVLPLALYLITFIVTFDDEQWYDRRVWLPILAGGLAATTLTLHADVDTDLTVQIVVYMSTLLACCMVCHGELVRLRPPAEGLTLFYLLVALGGALGGIFVGVVAPRLFDGYWELHLALVATYGLVAWCVVRRRRELPRLVGHPAPWLLGVLPLAAGLVLHVARYDDDMIAVTRSFYGVLRVGETHRDDPRRWKRRLFHGGIRHGDQLMAPARRHVATTYYTRETGISAAMRHHPARTAAPGPRGLHVGVAGLGTGTLAALARPGDRLRFYEIDPEVVRVAGTYFTYLADTPATVTIVPGDARLSLERELARGSQQLDILALDAFSGDAVPVHLLTLEAMALYGRHLRPDGILAVHISNRHLDLAPLVHGLAERTGKRALYVKADADERVSGQSSTWTLLTSNRAFLYDPEVARLAEHWPAAEDVVWTDDFSNLLQVLDLGD